MSFPVSRIGSPAGVCAQSTVTCTNATNRGLFIGNVSAYQTSEHLLHFLLHTAMTRRGLNLYLLWSALVAALGGLLFGFDTAVIAGTTRALTALYGLS